MRIIVAACLFVQVISAQAQPLLEDQPAEVLTASQWEEVNDSVERALVWLAAQQQPDGSFPTRMQGQPAVSSLCTMAFLAQGYVPGKGKYGSELKKALNYIASCQKQNGLLAVVGPNRTPISRNVDHKIGTTAVYNHAIAGLVLSESYAMSGGEATRTMGPVIDKALASTFSMQDWRKDRNIDEGGWRYLDSYDEYDSDLSITGWQLMFLRSAKNAGFDVEQQRIERAIGYVHRCFLKNEGTFSYKIERRNRASRGMAGAGILALAHSGFHHTDEARQAGDWILKSGFARYNEQGRVTGAKPRDDRYFYGLFTCSHAMYQLGGRHWQEFFPTTARVLMANQKSSGRWDAESNNGDKIYGTAYTTAIGVLTLSSSNQLLPIFQR